MRKHSYIKFILPTIIFLIVLTIFPILSTLFLSFSYFDLTAARGPQFVGFENYLGLFTDSRFINSIKVTLLLISIPVFFQMLIGLAVAIALNERVIGTNWMRLLFIVPAVLPPIVIGLIWKVFLIPQLGGLNYFLSLIGITGPDWLSVPFTALMAVAIASIWTGTPFVALMYLSTLETIPNEFYEVASIDGANWLQKQRFITLPFLRTVTKIVLVFRFLEALAIFPIIFILTRGGPAGATEPINFYAFITGFDYMKIGYASTLILVFFIILISISWPVLKSLVNQK